MSRNDIIRYSNCYKLGQIYENGQCIENVGQEYDLNLLNMYILKSIAKDIGLKSYTHMRKRELVKLLGKYHLRNFKEKMELMKLLSTFNVNSDRLINNLDVDADLDKLLHDSLYRDRERILTFSYKIIYPHKLGDKDMKRIRDFIKGLLRVPPSMSKGKETSISLGNIFD